MNGLKSVALLWINAALLLVVVAICTVIVVRLAIPPSSVYRETKKIQEDIAEIKAILEKGK